MNYFKKAYFGFAVITTLSTASLVFSSTAETFKGDINLSYTKNDVPWKYGHQYLGCPENSICQKDAAPIFHKWKTIFHNHQKFQGNRELNLLKEIQRFQSIYGLPINMLVKNIKPFASQGAFYPYRKDGTGMKMGKLYEGPIFIKRFDQYSKNYMFDKDNQDYFFDLYITKPVKSKKNVKGDYSKFFVPTGINLYNIKANSVNILQEEFGQYYIINISKNGKLSVKNASSESYSSKREVDCSKNFIVEFKNVLKEQLKISKNSIHEKKIQKSIQCYVWVNQKPYARFKGVKLTHLGPSHSISKADKL